MATYLATNDFDALTETNPTGSENAQLIDDAIRETRLVAKTVCKNAHTATGRHKCAIWRDATNRNFAAADTWTDLVPTEITDSGSITAAGGTANSIRPIAGTYKVSWTVSFYTTTESLTRIYNATGAAVLAYGAYVFLPGATNISSPSTGTAIVTFDGSTDLLLQGIVNTARSPGQGAAFGALGGSWPAAGSGEFFSEIVFELLYVA